MNIYKRELKFKIKSTLFWFLGILLFTLAGFSKFSIIDTEQADSINVMMDSMPNAIKAIYGINGLDLATLEGYTGVMINFIIVILALHGLFLGISHVGIEQKNKTMDFLFVKPTSKRNLLLQKMGAGLTVLLIFNILYSLITLLTIESKGGVGGALGAQMAMGFLLTDFFFYAVGVFLTICSKKKKIGGVGVFIFFLFYLLSVVSRMSEPLSWLEYLTPIQMVSGNNVVAGMNPFLPVGLFLLSVLLLIFSVIRIEKKEIE